MRVLLVGSESRYAIERPYLCHLSKKPTVSFIELFAAQNMFLEYYNRSLLNKITYRAGFSNILDTINDALKVKIIQVTPDVVFVFKGMEVLPKTLRWIRNRRIKLANYNPDNPFIFSGKGSGNENIRPSLELYDLHFTYNTSVKDRIEKDYDIPSKILPFGFDIPEDIYERSSAQDEILRTCFLGNPDRYRASFIAGLARCGVEIDVYGIGWSKFVKHDRITICRPVYGDELWKVLRRYRIQLNLMRPHNPYSHNMRTFEVPAIGGILLAPDTIDHRTFFTPAKEIFLFSEIADCIVQIGKLLNLTREQAHTIRLAARERSINSGYSYQSRADLVSLELERLVANKQS